jgi:hypothetical protein
MCVYRDPLNVQPGALPNGTGFSNSSAGLANIRRYFHYSHRDEYI